MTHTQTYPATARTVVGVVMVSMLCLGCGRASGPVAPTSAAPMPTRIIDVTGNLAFGMVTVGDTAQRSFQITNSGNAPLTFTGLTATGGTGTSGYTASPTSGTVAAGGAVTVTVQFKPVTGQFYSHVLTVTGDQTSGNNAINVSGTGFNPYPVFSKSGSGPAAFDLPTYVARVRIQGRLDGSGFITNFVVKIAGKLVVNEGVSSSSGFDGTYTTTGGLVEVSSGLYPVAWTFTEIR